MSEYKQNKAAAWLDAQAMPTSEEDLLYHEARDFALKDEKSYPAFPRSERDFKYYPPGYTEENYGRIQLIHNGFFLAPCPSYGHGYIYSGYWFFLIYPGAKVACFYLPTEILDHRSEKEVAELASQKAFVRLTVEYSSGLFRPEVREITLSEFFDDSIDSSRGLSGLGI